jgi:enterochelin esterase family protein
MADRSRRFDLDDSTAFPGTSHQVQVHAPPGLDPAEPIGVLLCLDGSGFLDPDDDVRAGAVLDDLVGRGVLPPTLGVFVDPGVRSDPDAGDGRRQRNVEYDAADDRCASLLLDEVVTLVARDWVLSPDPARRVVCGFSSGGNAAFTAAWHRPDGFGASVCFSASFAQMPGGNPYPALLGHTRRPRLRSYLHVGRQDLGWDEPAGSNWVAETLRVAAALLEDGHDVRLELGEGGHDSVDAGRLFPDAVRWAFGAA